MTSEPSQATTRLVPRPEATFPALRGALARLAPDRVADFHADRDHVSALATTSNSAAPIHGFLLKWATEVEILRRPALAARYQAALDAANSHNRDAPRWRTAMDDCLAVHDEARSSVVDNA